MIPAASVVGLRALVLDDNETNRFMLERQLTAKGLVVELASTGKEAVDKTMAAANAGQPFDLIFIDMHLPDMDGFQVAERVRERFPIGDLGIMMITSDDIAGGARKARELGMAAYLVKPIRTTALHQALTRIHETNAPVTVSAPVIAPLPPLECVRVLLADDNPVNLTVTETILRKAGVRVTPATNGAEAVEAFHKGSFHLILMDVQMPQMDGFEATRRIRATGSRVPIIGLTAHALEGDRARCLEAGMDDYLAKPVATAALLEKVGWWSEQYPVPAARPDKLLRQFEGDTEDMFVILRTFLDNVPAQMEEVRTAAANADAERLARAAHRLKGSLATMGAETAVCRTEMLEKTAKSGDLSPAEGMVAALDVELEKVKEVLKKSLTAEI